MNTGRDELRWEHWVAALLMAVMALIAFLNILGRYLFHYSLAFTEEVTIHCFVWLTVVGSGIAFERGSQLGLTTLYNHFPLRLKKLSIGLGAFLGAAIFLWIDILLVRTIYYELTLFHATSPALGIPIWIYYAGVPLLSTAVFRGILRGARARVRELHNPV